MWGVLQRRNNDLLRDIQYLLETLAQTPTPLELEAYRVRIQTTCEALAVLVRRNLLYLELDLPNILDDLLSTTSLVTKQVDLLSSRLAIPLLRADPADRLVLKIIAWQHQAHAETEDYPAAFIDGPCAIWPFVQIGSPLYIFSCIQQRGLLFLALLFHEFGHLLYARHKQELDDLVIELMRDIAESLVPSSQRNDRYAENQATRRQTIVTTWYSWTQELFCDAVGFVIGGPCYIEAFASYLSRMDSGDFYQLPQELVRSAHPVTWLRVRFLTRRATAAGFHNLAQRIEHEWGEVARIMGIVEDYHGFYHEELADLVLRTIEDMLTEVQPRAFTDHEVAGGDWHPASDSPVRLLNLAWQKYWAAPEHYGAWEADQIAALLQDMGKR
jgi:hypothetical protein